MLMAVLPAAACAPEFQVEETTIAEINAAMEAGRLTAEELVQSYLDRIEAYDKDGPYLNSIITVNEGALDRARELDEAFAESGFVGPLHGIPMIVKDNYDTYDLPTTNGTLAVSRRDSARRRISGAQDPRGRRHHSGQIQPRRVRLERRVHVELGPPGVFPEPVRPEAGHCGF